MLKSREFMRGKSRGRVGGGGTFTCNVILRRYSLLEVPWRRIHNAIAKAMSICVAYGNKVMDTRLPQPAGCGDKYDVSAWCRGRGFIVSSQSGRSMIEMLGVLAIIGVLSVGGIAGYSKAMEKYKLNKVMSEYSMLVYGILEHIDDFRKYRTQNNLALSNVLEALDVIPSSWHRDDKNDFIDDNGYTIRVFNHYGDDYEGTITIDFYLGGRSFNDSGNLTMAGSFPSKVCAEIINNIAVPLHSIMLNVWMYGADYNFYGSSYCGGGKKCLKDVTPAEAQEACSVCAKHSYCALVFYF